MLAQPADDALRGRRFSRAAQSCEPHTKSLAMLRRIALRQHLGHFAAREPFGQRTSFAEIVIANLSAGDGPRFGLWRNARRFFVAIFVRDVEELAERNHLHADLVFVPSDQ